MVQKQRLAHGRRGYDQRDQKHSVKVATLWVLPILLDSARDGNQRALKIAQILSGSDDGGVHMGDTRGRQFEYRASAEEVNPPAVKTGDREIIDRGQQS